MFATTIHGRKVYVNGSYFYIALRNHARYADTWVTAMATVQSDIFKPTKYGGKYTVTLIPGKI
jgi:hypothetical protein